MDNKDNLDLFNAANALVDIGEYLKAKSKFKEYTDLCPDDYKGWLGLLICRTRDFKIDDNNSLFQTEIDNYLKHFLLTAPDDVILDMRGQLEKYYNAEELSKMHKVFSDFYDFKKYNMIALIAGIAALVLWIATGIFGRMLSHFIALASMLLCIKKIRKKLKISHKIATIISIILFVVALLFIWVK